MKRIVGLFVIFCFALPLTVREAVTKSEPSLQNAPTKFAKSRNGMVATGSSYATEAAVKILESGGNAVDAAAAACLALMVTDPANTSIGGRAQILLRLRDGRVIAIDGATQTPAKVARLSEKEDRQGYAIVPVPGALAALEEMVRKYGRLKFSDVLRPAIELAENGYKVPPRLAATWARTHDALQKNKGAAMNFLKPDKSPYAEGELFRQPNLARVLREISKSGIAVFYRGDFADAIARDVAQHGGFITKSDLQNYRAQKGVVVRTNYRGYQVVSAGGRAWGNTLAEMLNILEHFSVNSNEPTAFEIETIARVIAQAMADRPQELGTLKPKQNGYSLNQLSSKQFGKQRAEQIKRLLPLEKSSSQTESKPDDTSHLSVMDAEGNAVSLTTSIGPSFGARVATPELGFLYAHSYRMRSDPTPLSRDLTEMTPSIVFRGNQALLVIGAAGSERIPTAILQVISNLLDRNYSLEKAMLAPRIFCLNNKLRMHKGFSAKLIEELRGRGFDIEIVELDSSRHLGLVHAVQYDPIGREFFGFADNGDSGSADSPAKQ